MTTHPKQQVGPVARRSFWRSEGGVSAVEFALIAPVMIGALVGMIDIGSAINVRMSIDHVVRAAGQVAMADPGRDVVLQSLENLATGRGYSVAVELYCACAGNEACAEPCTDPAAYSGYRLSAATTYRSLITPFELDMASSIRVQVR